MPIGNICAKMDDALRAYLIDVGAGGEADIFPGKWSANKTLPVTICWAHSARPMQEAPYSNTWEVEAFIEVRTSGVQEKNQSNTDPKDAANTRTAATMDAFFAGVTDDTSAPLAAAITQAASVEDIAVLTVIACKVVEMNQGFNPRAVRDMGNAWIDTIHLQLLVCPGQVSV